MYRIGNKILKNSAFLYKAENQTIIELDVRGTCFPAQSGTGTSFNITSDNGNIMHIDYDDGTGIHDYLPNNSSKNFKYIGSNKMHFYQDLLDPLKINTVDGNYPQQRKIKIWFDYPQRVKGIEFSLFQIYGDFPKNTGNYNLDSLRLSGTKYITDFPIRFRGGVFRSLQLIKFSDTKPLKFPTWIGRSEIFSLVLTECFNLSGGSAFTGIDTISECSTLTKLTLSELNLNTNDCFPTTLKDITTLRELKIGGNNLTIVPDRVTDSPYLDYLSLANGDGSGYNPLMASWGQGLSKMVNLKELIYFGIREIPTTIPGLEFCTLLKKLKFDNAFRTQERTDEHITFLYNLVLNNASTTLGDTKFRNMTIENSATQSGINTLRPSGGATPTSTVYPATTPMQMVYNLCKTYGHTWTIRNFADTDSETITPTS